MRRLKRELLVNKPLLTTGALLFGALTFATPKQAVADIRVSIGGGVRIGSPRWRQPVYRPYYRPHHAIGGAIWIGGGSYSGYGGYRTYAAPPPEPTCNCGPGAVPSYYPGYYSTAQPAYTAPAAPAPLPRFGIGAFAGSFESNGEPGRDLGLMARLRLSGGWLLEGEVGASEFQSAHDQGLDPQRRMGAALVYEIVARNSWAPYLVAGMGAVQSMHQSDPQGFGELGIGLRWALTDNLHLAVDIRAGNQGKPDEAVDAPTAARVVIPNDPSFSDSGEDYTRGRLSAMLYF
jgi:hypothetical protein